MTQPDPKPPQTDQSDAPVPTPGRGLRASHVAAVAVVGVLSLVIHWIPFGPSDLWADLKFGEWMVRHGRLPDREPFSPFSDKDVPVLHDRWLSQGGLYLTYRSGEWLAATPRGEGGVAMLRYLRLLLVVVYFGLLLGAYRRAGGSLPLACAGLLLAGAAGPMSLAVLRPEVFGLVCFAALLFVLSRPLLSWRAVFFVPVLLVLWANLHGSFVVGLILLAVFLAGRAVEVWADASSVNPLLPLGDRQFRRLLVVGLISAGAASVLTPDGPSLLPRLIRWVRDANVQTMPGWQPLDFSKPELTHWAYLASLVLIGLSQLFSPRALSPTRLLLTATFALMPLGERRMLLWWFPLVPWIAVPCWAAIGERPGWNWLRWRSRPGSWKSAAWVVAGSFLVLIAWGDGLYRLRPPLLSLTLARETPWEVIEQIRHPAMGRGKLAETVRANYPDGRFTGRVYAGETLGDYLLWALPPECPVLIYGRVRFFPADHWNEVQAVGKAEPEWWDVLDRRRVNLIAVEPRKHERLVTLLRDDPDWQLIEEVPRKLCVFLRKNPLPAK